MKILLESAFKFAVRRGSLKVIRANGEGLTFGDGTGQPVTIRFTDAKAELECGLDPELKFGELYTDQRIVIEEGDLYALVVLLIQDMRIIKTPWPFSWVEAIKLWSARRRPANTSGRARRNVAHHYDLGDALYALFLDPDWQYSCAYYENDDQTLAEAQLNKKRHLAAKLRITPDTGDRLRLGRTGALSGGDCRGPPRHRRYPVDRADHPGAGAGQSRRSRRQDRFQLPGLSQHRGQVRPHRLGRHVRTRRPGLL